MKYGMKKQACISNSEAFSDTLRRRISLLATWHTCFQVQYFSKVEYIHLFFGLGKWTVLSGPICGPWSSCCRKTNMTTGSQSWYSMQMPNKKGSWKTRQDGQTQVRFEFSILNCNLTRSYQITQSSMVGSLRPMVIMTVGRVKAMCRSRCVLAVLSRPSCAPPKVFLEEWV